MGILGCLLLVFIGVFGFFDCDDVGWFDVEFVVCVGVYCFGDFDLLFGWVFVWVY